jgi:hypothetical protein
MLTFFIRKERLSPATTVEESTERVRREREKPEASKY